MPRKKKKPETITFRCTDSETLAALGELVASLGPGVSGAQSSAIRKAIINEAARLRLEKKTTT